MTALRCQTLRCEENKPVNQLWQSLRGTLTSLFYCVANTQEISFFYINFLCLHLFECKYDTTRASLLFLVRWSLAMNESFMRGFIFKERIKSKTSEEHLVKTICNYIPPKIIPSCYLFIFPPPRKHCHKIANFIQTKASVVQGSNTVYNAAENGGGELICSSCCFGEITV